MNITACNNTNSFGLLLGKREITHFIDGDKEKVTTTQYLYPFKDEFKSSAEVDRALEQFKRSDFFKEENTPNGKNGSQREYKIHIGNTLPFTRIEFINTVKYPESIYASKKVANFINSPDYNSTIIKSAGTIPAKLLEHGQLEYVI